MRDRAHDTSMAEVFQRDPAYAAEVLNSVLADGDSEELYATLRQLTLAFNIESSADSDMRTLLAVLKSLGLQLTVTANEIQP